MMLAHNVDVHILTMRNHPPYGRRENLPYILDVLSREPVNVHLVDVDEVGCETNMRIKALKMGTSEWVGWVDPDDELIPGAYQMLLDYKESHPFVWSNELVNTFNSDGKLVSTVIYKEPHHMMIVHRDVLDFEALNKTKFSTVLALHPLKAIGMHVNEIGYVWNRHADSDCEVAITSIVQPSPIKSLASCSDKFLIYFSGIVFSFARSSFHKYLAQLKISPL